jgi:RNA polymerase sigma-70 factor, ECF subfamily
MDSAYNLARWITGHDQDAEDIVQEAYIRAFRSFDKYTEINSLSWLLTIVRNTSYNWLKNKHVRKQQVEFDETLHSAKLEPAYSAGRHKESRQERLFNAAGHKELLDSALKNMPLIFREVIVLHDLEGLSYKEIADIVSIPIGTVMSRLSQVRRRLQTVISKRLKRKGMSEF